MAVTIEQSISWEVVENEGEKGEEKEEIIRLKGLRAERDSTANHLGKIIIDLEKDLKAKQEANLDKNLDQSVIEIRRHEGKQLLDHHKQIAEEETKRAYNLEIDKKKLNEEIKRIPSDFEKLDIKMKKVEHELKEKEENNDKLVPEPDHPRNQERYYKDMTGKIIKGVADKILRNNSEELEAERARYDNKLREILEVKVEKPTKLTKNKKQIEKLKEQIKKHEKSTD